MEHLISPQIMKFFRKKQEILLFEFLQTLIFIRENWGSIKHRAVTNDFFNQILDYTKRDLHEFMDIIGILIHRRNDRQNSK